MHDPVLLQSEAKGHWEHSGQGCTLSSPQPPPLPVGGDTPDGDRDVSLQCFQAPPNQFHIEFFTLATPQVLAASLEEEDLS